MQFSFGHLHNNGKNNDKILVILYQASPVLLNVLDHSILGVSLMFFLWGT